MQTLSGPDALIRKRICEEMTIPLVDIVELSNRA